MARTLSGNLTGGAAHGHDELAPALTSSNDAVLAYIKARMDPEKYHLWFNQVFGLYYYSDNKRYVAELRAKRDELATAAAAAAARHNPGCQPIKTGTLAMDRAGHGG